MQGKHTKIRWRKVTNRRLTTIPYTTATKQTNSNETKNLNSRRHNAHTHTRTQTQNTHVYFGTNSHAYICMLKLIDDISSLSFAPFCDARFGGGIPGMDGLGAGKCHRPRLRSFFLLLLLLLLIIIIIEIL